VRPAALALEGPGLKPGETSEGVRRLQRQLQAYGYGIDDTGSYGQQTRVIVTEFQRHFRQERIDGIADASTLLTLRALMETRPLPLG
jgi:N-acetylmuramoyl-L-alanine amidase